MYLSRVWTTPWNTGCNQHLTDEPTAFRCTTVGAAPVECVVFDPSEKKVVAGSKSGAIKAYDMEAAKVYRTLKGHMSNCTAIDYHLYGDYVAYIATGVAVAKMLVGSFGPLVRDNRESRKNSREINFASEDRSVPPLHIFVIP
ncbi:hypothetical protein DYB32_000724 [Aphanomyces invadans]|uniref:Uncharacterized protein n=1 Tax=Aphanomyces invadans TaxID=157072 RepID=A0A3R6Z5H2_9STRA|nr:hypothetical protein DYB32_000724 [Aphanomyces invadans]